MTATDKTETAAQLDLDKLEALARAATPGPWVHRHDPGNPAGVQHGVKLMGEFGPWVADFLDNADRSKVGGVAGDRNAQFVAAANPAAILELIAQARAQPAAAPAIPDVLFDGMAVYNEVMANEPNTPHPTADNISDTLDAIFRLIKRAAPIAPSVNSGEGAPSVKPWRECADALDGPDKRLKLADAEIADLRAQLAQQRQAAPHAQAEPVYQVDTGNGWRDIQKFDYDLYVEHSDGSIRTRIVYASPAPQEAEQAAADPSDKEIYDTLGLYGALPTKDGAPDRIIKGREGVLILAIREILGKAYAATRLRDVRSLTLSGIRTIDAAQEAEQASASPAGADGWQRITEPGQVKVGDKLRFTIGDVTFNERVKLIVNEGYPDEELIYNKRRNFYVITSNAITNFGSSKNVEFLPTTTKG